MLPTCSWVLWNIAKVDRGRLLVCRQTLLNPAVPNIARSFVRALKDG